MALEARREVPAPVRAFVKDSLELRPSGCLYVMVASWFAPLLFGRMFVSGAFGVLPFVAFLGIAFVGLPLLAQGLAGGTRVKEVLREYAGASKGKITLSIVSPEPFSDAEDRAVQEDRFRERARPRPRSTRSRRPGAGRDSSAYARR